MAVVAALIVCIAAAVAYDLEALEALISSLPTSATGVGSAPHIQRRDTLTFPCTVHTSATNPTSVHELRPSDIKVVAAMGDSITAAFGAQATSLSDLYGEWRGSSFSGGAEGTFESNPTLPNIFKAFNAASVGGAVGVYPPYATPTDGFNVAKTGADAYDMIGQANLLVQQLSADDRVNMESDWKVVTIFIGSNDLCRTCNGNASNSPQLYIQYLESAIDILLSSVCVAHRRTSFPSLTLFEQVPRVFINIVTAIDVTKLKTQATAGLCPLLHQVRVKADLLLINTMLIPPAAVRVRVLLHQHGHADVGQRL